MSFAFIGGPGSGKGTQSRKLSKHLKMSLFTMGDALRERIQEGDQIKDYVAKQEEDVKQLLNQHLELDKEYLLLKEKSELVTAKDNDFYVRIGHRFGEMKQVLSDLQGKIASKEDIIDRTLKEYEEIKGSIDTIESCLKKGILVPDSVVVPILSDSMKQADMILDGFPRSIDQAKALDSLIERDNLKNLTLIFYLKIPKEEMIKRLAGRFSCNKCGIIYNLIYRSMDKPCCDSKNFSFRNDDENMSSVDTRIKIFEANVQEIEEFYAKRGVLKEISGLDAVDNIFDEIVNIIKNVQKS